MKRRSRFEALCSVEEGREVERENLNMGKWNRLRQQIPGEVREDYQFPWNRALGCVNPFQEVTLEEETKEVREVISDGLNHFWDGGILITCQEKDCLFR